MRKRRIDPAFTDARCMRAGDNIVYDPSKEGTGEKKGGVIKEISRTSLSLVLEDGTAIGVTRVFECHRPDTEAPVFSYQAPREQPQRKERRLTRRPKEGPAEKYISWPF